MITRRTLLEALSVAVALSRSKVHAAAQPATGAALYPNLAPTKPRLI